MSFKEECCGRPKIREDDGDENIMIGNISFCLECAESLEGEKAMEYYDEIDRREEKEDDEKTYKCSDCDAWVKPTESCCGSEVEEE